MLPKMFRPGVVAAMSVFATAEQPAPPRVKVHVLNLCTPSREEPKEIAGALANLLKPPIFEVARGRSPVWDDAAIRGGENASVSGQPAGATRVRMRRIRLARFGKPSVVPARSMASKSGPPLDQGAYEQFFQDASSVMDRHRTLLQARPTFPEELAKVGSASVKSETSPQPAARRTGRS